MIGQFMAPTCEAANLKARILLRNTEREGQAVPDVLRDEGLHVDLRVFEQGRLRFHAPDFAHVCFDDVVEITEESCPALRVDQHELLIVARCSVPGHSSFYNQEHCLMYQNRRTGVFDSLLYDQIPPPRRDRKPSPIVVIAPKAWVGERFNSYVTFSNSTDAIEPRRQAVPLQVSVLDEQGTILASREYEEFENSVLLFDVREAICGRIALTRTPRFFNVVARGGASSYAIMTFVSNDETGNFALEHSLSPHYYMSGDFARVRSEALVFASKRG